MTHLQSADEKQLAFDLGKLPPSQIPALWTVEQIYEYASTRTFRALKEDRRIERKAGLVKANALGECFSMWANTPEGGILVVGMENDGTISGLKDMASQIINEIEDCPRVFCPDARFQSKRVPVENHKGYVDFIIVFWVQYRKDKVVKTTNSKVFKRSGANKQELHDDEIRELQIEKGELQLELEPINMRFPDDFDEVLVNEFCRNVAMKNGLELRHTIEEILCQQKLGERQSGEFIPNIACCLLFAKDPRDHFAGCKVRFMRFEGEFEKTGRDYNCVKDITVNGPIPKLIVETEKIVASQLREFSALGSDGRFYVMPEYPQVAWYEAIVNACVHRSYNLRNMNIFIKMFDDKLVVMSPGTFPAMVTPENIYEMHNPRNPFIMDALRYLEFVKCANEGTRRMRAAMIENSLPIPRFEMTQSGEGNVLVTFQNDCKHRRRFIDSNAASTVVSADLFRILTDNEKRIINYVVEYQTIKVAQAAKLLNIDWATAKKLLEKLNTKEILVRNGRKDIARDSKAFYEFNPKLVKQKPN